MLHPNDFPVTNDPSKARYIVFHPASDWRTRFSSLQSGEWCDKFFESNPVQHFLNRITLFNNPEKFAAHLRDYDKSEAIEGTNNTRSVTHVLLPSAHTYTLPFILRIPQGLQPVRIVGQTDRNGKPYCRACITGVDPADVVEVELLSEHEDANYMPTSSALDKRIYPLLWLIIAALWSKDVLGKVVNFARDVVWTAWKTYLRLTDLLSFGITKFLSFGAA